jgi:RNA polymerase sigma factor (sigma-70 family)
MAQGQLDVVLRYIRKLAGTKEVGTATDRQLLERFTALRDESAFATLVGRHGPMVFGVCQRILRNEHDAEDAFQATFLVLAHKAKSQRWQESVGGWLYEVACRVARKARADRARRQVRERQVAIVPSVDPLSFAAGREIQAVLDEELCRLPEKYRLPVVLCYLEGRSRSEAARQLGWKEGTVAGRLARGRSLLQKRLARRGITVPAAVLAAALTESLAKATAPTALIMTTTKAASRVAAGQLIASGLISAQSVALAKQVLRAMFLSKLQTAVMVLAVAATVTGTGMFTHQALRGQDERGKQEAIPGPSARVTPEPPPPPQEDHQSTKENLKERAKAVRTEAPKKPSYPSTLPERFRLPLPEEAVALEFSPDGAVLAVYSGRDPHRLNLWDTVTGDLITGLDLVGQGLNSRPFAFSADGKNLAVVQLAGHKVLYCDPVTAEVRRTLLLPEPGGIGPVLLRFSMDGNLLAVALDADKARVMDSSTGKCVREVQNPTHHTIFAMEFSPDGQMLALGTADDPSLQLWDLASGKCMNRFDQRPHDGIITSLAFSRDGRLLAAGRGNRIVLWDAASGRERVRFEGPMGLVNGVAFTSDAKMLVAASADGNARIFDLSSSRLLYTLGGGAEGRSMALTPDATTLALGTTQQAVVWALPFAKQGPPAKISNPLEADLESLWPALAGQDGKKVHQAVRQMLAVPKGTVSFLGRHLDAIQAKLEPGPEIRDQLRRLIAELNSNSFERREAATRELKKMGSQAEVPLRQALGSAASAEIRTRLEQVLKGIEETSIQASRALRILEYLGTPAAKQLLEKLSHGPPEARLTQEAKAAQERLAKRLPSGPCGCIP